MEWTREKREELAFLLTPQSSIDFVRGIDYLGEQLKLLLATSIDSVKTAEVESLDTFIADKEKVAEAKQLYYGVELGITDDIEQMKTDMVNVVAKVMMKYRPKEATIDDSGQFVSTLPFVTVTKERI